MQAVSLFVVAVTAVAAEPSADRRSPTSWPPASPRATTRPTTRVARGDHIVVYKKGVAINWTKRQVELQGTIAFRQGPLELFACATDRYGGDKTHESIVLLKGRPLHIFQALGLIGLEPGSPPRWNEATNKIIPATGQPVTVRVEWIFDGHRREASAHEWMRRIDKPDESLEPLHWVFSGSRPMPDGGILADEDGTVITLVDFDGAIISLREHHPRDYSQMWIEARTEKIPPMNAPCTVLVQAAGLWITLDRFGRVHVGAKRHDDVSLAKTVERYLRKHSMGRVFVLVAPTTLETDVNRLSGVLHAAGVSDGQLQVYRQPEACFPKDDPRAGRAFLRDQLRLQRSLLESAQREHGGWLEQLAERHARFQARATAVGEYVTRLRKGLTDLADRAARPAGPAAGAAGEKVGPDRPDQPASPTTDPP